MVASPRQMDHRNPLRAVFEGEKHVVTIRATPDGAKRLAEKGMSRRQFAMQFGCEIGGIHLYFDRLPRLDPFHDDRPMSPNIASELLYVTSRLSPSTHRPSTKKRPDTDVGGTRASVLKSRRAGDRAQALAVALASVWAFLTISSWNLLGSFWYLRNSMLKLPLPWVMLRRSLE